ncbi:glutathione S-transferase family protein [Pelagibius litoralis]|uniref:Glutathione S-transferase family protein n=1 Tax=Pelagibius litoralis TaxID=374515 RepID=A0A967F0H4_9PROT|nr:glutathione S-transferase N-terminal domain-containing protein [Pelagibius litoralis]NIA70809.1 glutathione S-transferase family protein [Pelagibius litoralis]
MATLFTFGASHYCEKARWSLDLCDFTCREVRWAPGPHLLSARRIAPQSTVPILRCPRKTIQGSDRIMNWIEDSGRAAWTTEAPAAEKAEIARLEERADSGIGVAVRRLIYAMSLATEDRKVAQQLFRGALWWHRPLARLMWPISRQAIMKGLQATAEDVPAARSALERELDYVDELIADGLIGGRRRFLVGDRFSRADLAVASLLSPIALPPQHPFYRDMPRWDAQQKIAETYQDRPCILWTSRIYRDFRYPGNLAAVQSA